MSVTYPQVERRERLAAEEFHRRYVDRAPVVITGVAAAWPAITTWTLDRLREIGADVEGRVRPGDDATGAAESIRMGDFLDVVAAYRRDRAGDGAATSGRPPYLHDTPMTPMLTAVRRDIRPFPVEYFPRWYRDEWWFFALLFVGVDSLTPLHFDTQETHNLFFQITGHKRFIIVPPRARRCCYAYDWRWSPIDAASPDLALYPRFRDATPVECTLGPGEILYIPSRAFHQVRGPDFTVSFNIDWHTRRSALRGMLAFFRGMPLRYVASNAIHAIGLWTGTPSRVLQGLYRRHLETVD